MTGEQCEVMVEEFNALKARIETEGNKLGEQLAVTNTLLQSILDRLKGEHWNGGFTSSEDPMPFLNGIINKACETPKKEKKHSNNKASQTINKKEK